MYSKGDGGKDISVCKAGEAVMALVKALSV